MCDRNTHCYHAEFARVRAENEDLKRQLAAAKHQAEIYREEVMKREAAEAREVKLRNFVTRVAKAYKSKPDHWSICDQCERFKDVAEGLLDELGYVHRITDTDRLEWLAKNAKVAHIHTAPFKKEAITRAAIDAAIRAATEDSR